MDRAQLPQDPISGNMKIIEPEHGVIHDGTHFTITRPMTLSAGSVNTLLITTPSAGAGYVHFICGVESDKSLTWYLYEGASTSGGSAITALNNNRNSSTADIVTLKGNPVITTVGTVMEVHRMGSTAASSRTGGGTNTRNEWVLATSTSYLVYVIADAASTQTVINAPYYYRA